MLNTELFFPQSFLYIVDTERKNKHKVKPKVHSLRRETSTTVYIIRSTFHISTKRFGFHEYISLLCFLKLPLRKAQVAGYGGPRF